MVIDTGFYSELIRGAGGGEQTILDLDPSTCRKNACSELMYYVKALVES